MSITAIVAEARRRRHHRWHRPLWMKKLGWERRQIRVALLVIGVFAVFQFLMWNMAFR
jgi:hypothetical protein